MTWDSERVSTVLSPRRPPSDGWILLLAVVAVVLLMLLTGCSGFTIGPQIERKAIIVRAGSPIEILENESVEAHILGDNESADVFYQDIGGWIAMPPDHWEAVKREIEKLRKKQGE